MANTHEPDGTGFRSDVQDLGRDVGDIKSDMNHLAHDAVQAARSGAAELGQGACRAAEMAKDTAVDTVASMKHKIANNPAASVGIAAGVGFLIGLIMFRPRS